MKLEKAIEILSDSANRGVTTFNEEFKDAEKLGIEALKDKLINRRASGAVFPDLLPGESKE